MKLRTKLIVAFLLTGVVPLFGVTVYSYVTTQRAYRRAVEAEATASAREMSGRIEQVTADLGRRLEKLGDLPFGPLFVGHAQPGDPAAAEILERMRSEMGDAAELVESVEYSPMPPPAPPEVPHPGPARSAPRARQPPAEPTTGAAETTIVLWPEPPDFPDSPAAPPPTGGEPLLQEKRRWVFKYKAIAKAAEDARRVAEEQKQVVQEARRAVEEARAIGKRDPEAERQLKELERAFEQAAEEVGKVASAAVTKAVIEGTKAIQERGGIEGIREATRVALDVAAQATAQAGKTWRFHLDKPIDFTVHHKGTPVAKLKTQVREQTLIDRVLAGPRKRSDEVPFAVSPGGKLHAPSADLDRIAPLRLAALGTGSTPAGVHTVKGNWVVVTRRDETSGLTLGIARPLGASLKEIRLAAARNLVSGLGLVGLALVGVLPLSRRMTRDLGALTAGAESLARGDRDVRVPVRSRDEIGRLADTFNRMAEDLKTQEERLLVQERLRKELEMGRRIQEEMLPHAALRASFAEVTGISIPAREVGGDFFNYFLLDGGEAALVVGDVSGKGVAAALLMANIQATLRARLPLQRDLASLASHLDREIDATTPTTVYLTCFLGVLDGDKRQMRYVNAGHNPPVVLRASGRIERLEPTGRPLGLLPGGPFEERAIDFEDGDCLLLYTDGIVETEDEAGEPFGLERLEAILRRERQAGLEGLLARVETAVREYRGPHEAADDATLVALRVGRPGPA